jgi:uncharacterized protein YdeI (YjbR/CyaY-like superfamily)
MKPTFFKSQKDWRHWLEKNHEQKDELIVGYYKVKSGIESINWPQSVDEALCFGWIDGIRRSIDENSYCIRFTPRRKNSNWSAVNIKRINELIKLDLVHTSGLQVFQNRDSKKDEPYSYEKAQILFSKEYESILKANKKAWVYFQTLSPYIKKQSTGWVMSAKREDTRMRRLDVLISSAEKGEKIPQLNISKKDK